MLISRMRKVEEENQQLRAQLRQSQGMAHVQEGNYGNQQWVASADTGTEDGENTAEERVNGTDCERRPMVEKCEVRTTWPLAEDWEVGGVGHVVRG